MWSFYIELFLTEFVNNKIFIISNNNCMFLLLTAQLKPLLFQNIPSDEFTLVAKIEDRLGKLSEKTLSTRRENNVESIEKIMLRISYTATFAHARNEIFAETQTIFQNDDDEEEAGETRKQSGSRSLYVPTVGLDESLFTVPTYYLLQVF